MLTYGEGWLTIRNPNFSERGRRELFEKRANHIKENESRKQLKLPIVRAALRFTQEILTADANLGQTGRDQRQRDSLGNREDSPVTESKPVLPEPGPLVLPLYASTTKYAGPSPPAGLAASPPARRGWEVNHNSECAGSCASIICSACDAGSLWSPRIPITLVRCIRIRRAAWC